MKNILTFIQNWIGGHIWLALTIIFIVGIVAGNLIFSSGSNKNIEETQLTEEDHDHVPGTVWTCAMHPQIRADEPGNCPICGMELVPVESEDESDEDGDYTVKLSNAAMKIAEVSTSLIKSKSPYKEVYLPGKVVPDERNISELTARFPGRIEKLFVNFTGQKVRKGEVLAKIYSPELVTAQKELFEAMKFQESNPGYFQAARNKLKLWDLTDEQIDEISESGDVKFYFDVLSPLTGTVTMRMVSLGDYIKEGYSLFQIIDLSHVWVMFDAYESDIPWIKLRDKITFKIKSIPDAEFESTVTFIDPVLNPKSRVAGVRAELNNPKDLLKPEMLTSGILKTMLPGGNKLLVPKSAVLWTGKKAVVYVRTNDHQNMFRFTEITLGADAGDYYVVLDGLEEGDLVASNGAFKIDAAAQLLGEKSMMNPEGGKVSLAHDHGSMEGTEKIDTEMKDSDMDEGRSESTPVMNMDINEDFKIQLTEVYRSQLELQEKFIASDLKAVKNAITIVSDALNNVDMTLLKGEMHDHWMETSIQLQKSLKWIDDSESLDEQRRGYSDFNDALYKAIKMFGTSGEVIYYQFCPMANNNKGAYWLTGSKEIENPYYGEMMLTCGETKEVIE